MKRFPLRVHPAALLGAVVPFLVLTGCGGGSSSGGPSPNPTATPTAGPTPTTGPTPTPTPQQVPTFAFVSTRDGNSEIYLATNNALTQTRITTDPGADSDPSVSPDGRSVVFSSTRDGNSEIYFYSLDGPDPKLRRYTSDSGAFAPSDTAPAFSPDGSTIAWVSGRGSNPNIWLMDATGANQRQLTNITQAGVRDPSWSPGGGSIAFVTSLSTGSVLRVANSSTGASSALVTSGEDIYSPSFNGADTKIVYSLVPRRTGPQRLAIVDVATGTVIAGPTSGLAININPSWNKSVDLIAYQSVASGLGAQIYVSPSTGGTSRQLTTLGANSSPSF